MLFDDQHAAQRHHHQHAKDAAGDSEDGDLRVGEIRRSERQEEEHRWNREDDSRSERLTGGSNRLDDVVLEDRRAAKLLQYRNRKDGNRDRCADGQSCAQTEIRGGRTEDKPEQHTQDDGLAGEFRDHLRCRYVRLESSSFTGFLARCRHVRHGARW